MQKKLYIIGNNGKTPTDVLKNLSGVIICFLRIKYCLSVGAFFEHLRANTVRPYRGLGDFSAKNITLSFGCFFFFLAIRFRNHSQPFRCITGKQDAHTTPEHQLWG